MGYVFIGYTLFFLFINLKQNIMCLNLEEGKLGRLKAKEDIVCYKYLSIVTKLKEEYIDKLHGIKFIGTINNEENVKGLIYVSNPNIVFFCTNNRRLNGSEIDNKFGYKYSWLMDYSVKSILINESEEIIDKVLCTPYQRFPIEIGETYESDLIKRYGNQIYKGLHSFGNLNEAIEDAKLDCDIIVKCIIPKGSTYYIGKFNDKVSYASNKLKYLEIININKEGE